MRGMTKQLYEMRYIVAKNGRGGAWGRGGRKVCVCVCVCVFGRRRGELVQVLPKVQVRREQKSTQLGTRWQVQVAGAGQQAALASKRQLNN